MDRVSERVAEQMAVFRERKAARRVADAERRVRRAAGLKARHATKLGLRNGPVSEEGRAV
jgi:hypothetical protein